MLKGLAKPTLTQILIALYLLYTMRYFSQDWFVQFLMWLIPSAPSGSPTQNPCPSQTHELCVLPPTPLYYVLKIYVIETIVGFTLCYLVAFVATTLLRFALPKRR